MSSDAARANQKIKRLTAKGTDIATAFREIADASGAKTGHDSKGLYAHFSDQSFIQVVLHPVDTRREPFSCVITDGASCERAYHTIYDIHAYCDQCGDEVRCDRRGNPWLEFVFKLPGQNVTVCYKCQRQMVVRALVGE